MRIKKQKNNLVFLLFSLCCLLALFGLLMIYNASNFEAYRIFSDKYHYVKSQALWIAIGLVFLLLTASLPYRKLKLISFPLIIISCFFLLLVLSPGVGTKALGARRWINLAGFSFQPSEFIKISLCIYLAAWLEKKKSILPFLALIFSLVGLIALQPDMGTGIVILITAFLVYFVAGGSTGKLIIFSFIGLILGIFLIFSSEYRSNRIKTFINPSQDPLGTSYHMRQILMALGSGGLSGVGLGQSKQKYQYLPESTGDSIFAVIAEETGFFGSTVLILLYLLLIYIGLKITENAKDQFGRLLACGLTCWIGVQAFVNFAAMVSLLPLTGIPLPLVSYGGSSLIVSMISIGILISIARDSKSNRIN